MVLRMQPTNKKNRSTSDVELLDESDIDDEGFIDGDISTGKVLSAFSFGMSSTSSDNNTLIITEAPTENKIDTSLDIDKQVYPSAPRGLTPPINGEHYTVKRSYSMRPSTVRKLNALKADHPDVNVLFNTIVDMAISHYYNYIVNEKGSYSYQEEKKKTS